MGAQLSNKDAKMRKPDAKKLNNKMHNSATTWDVLNGDSVTSHAGRR